LVSQHHQKSSTSARLSISVAVFAQHLDPHRAHNDELAQARISDADGELEFWFHELPKDRISDFEKSLIRAASPKTNKILYSSKP
jgi:hypothetical protein